MYLNKHVVKKHNINEKGKIVVELEDAACITSLVSKQLRQSIFSVCRITLSYRIILVKGKKRKKDTFKLINLSLMLSFAILIQHVQL